MPAADLAAHCANHPEALSVGTCVGCGSVVCGACQTVCPTCAPASPRRPLIALALAILAVPVWFTATWNPTGFIFGLPASMLIAAFAFLVMLDEKRARKRERRTVPSKLYFAVWYLVLTEVLFALSLGWGIIQAGLK